MIPQIEHLTMPGALHYRYAIPGLSMQGHIRCAKCEKAMMGELCAHCGSGICYVSLYWKGTHYKYRRYYQDAMPLNYRRAERQLTVMRSQIDNRTFTPVDWTDSKIAERRFERKLDEWLQAKEDEMKAHELAPETVRMYQSYTRNYYREYFKGYDVREIKFEQLESFKDSLRQYQLHIKTRKNIIAILHSFFAYLKRKGTVVDIPQFPTIEGDDSRMKVMIEYDDQIQALKRIPEPYRDAIEFSMETGLRPGELCALKVKDLFIEQHKALIQRTYSGNVLKETTKAKSKKYIPLSDRAIEILQLHIRDKMPESFVFINPMTRQGFRPRVLSNAWKKYSGIEIDLYEATRHSFCSQIVEMGINAFQAKALMRHTDMRSTEKYYHASPKRLCDIVNQRGKVVPFTRSGTVPKESAK